MDWPSEFAACKNVLEYLTAKRSAAFAYRAVYADLDFLAEVHGVFPTMCRQKNGQPFGNER